MVRFMFSSAIKVDDNDLGEQKQLFKMRPKNIDLYGSAISYKNVRLDLVNQKINSKSKKLTAPLKLSRVSHKLIEGPQINYDLDSEEELDDINGENVANDDFSDEDAEPQHAEDLYEEGWIVDDDDFEQLSETSYEDNDDGERIPKDLNRFQLKRNNAKRLYEARKAMVSGKKLIMIEICNKGSEGADQAEKPFNISTNLEQFQAVSFMQPSNSFPIKPKPSKIAKQETPKKSKRKLEDHIIDKILEKAEIV